jgi:serine/threonine protein kinase
VYYLRQQVLVDLMKRCPTCQTAFPSDYALCPRDGSALVEVGEWAEGYVVRGKYRILAKVGQGGMGAVYKAMHTRFKEVRALKVMSPELASDANFLRRFEREAVIARKLQHANAVRVEDIDEAEDGRPFIVMEFIEGRSLADVIEQEAPMVAPRVCSIIKQAAAALDSAHALGLIHRDIKPSNIALIPSTDGIGTVAEQVKVLDFGIAKVRDAQIEGAPHFTRLTLTGAGMLVGTPAYMSPEQAKGLPGDQVDGRSDLYSLGVVMYEMLTGELPLKANTTAEQLAAVINALPMPVREFRPELGIPEPIDAVVMRCLEKDPAMRPASGQALIEELDFATRKRPPVSRPRRSAAPVPLPPEPTEEITIATEEEQPSGDEKKETTTRDLWMLSISYILVVIVVILLIAWYVTYH